MKAKLVFKLPEEKEEFMFAQQGMSYRCALSEFDTKLRNKIKYTDDEPKNWQEVRDLFHETLKEFEVEIWTAL